MFMLRTDKEPYKNINSVEDIQNINNTKTICSYIVSDDEININNLKLF